MKRIIEDGNRSGWNRLLANVYKLLQECERRFGTLYQASDGFLKTTHYLEKMDDSNLGNQAREAYRSSKKTSNIDKTVTDDPGVEAFLTHSELRLIVSNNLKLLRIQLCTYRSATAGHIPLVGDGVEREYRVPAPHITRRAHIGAFPHGVHCWPEGGC